MLVLTRKTSQVIQLGTDITITVVRTSNGSVKLGIEAPPEIRIARTERLPVNDRFETVPNASIQPRFG